MANLWVLPLDAAPWRRPFKGIVFPYECCMYNILVHQLSNTNFIKLAAQQTQETSPIGPVWTLTPLWILPGAFHSGFYFMVSNPQNSSAV